MKNTPRKLRWLLWLAPLLFASTLMADETDIYYAQNTSANPNILFVLDNSGSMNCTDPNTGAVIPACLSGGKTRLEILKDVFGQVMDSVPANLNIGVMRYGGHKDYRANGVSFPVKPIELDKDNNGSAHDIINARIAPGLDNLPNPLGDKQPVREFLKDVVTDWQAEGYTPIVDALYEASLYFGGKDVLFGKRDPAHVQAAHPASYTGTAGWDMAGGYCSDTWTCLKEYCYPESYVVSNCRNESTPVCTEYKDEPTGGCCSYTETHDEAGNFSGAVCTGGYTCPTTVCSKTENQIKEVCDAKSCEGIGTGNAKYESPIKESCQSNYIVLMSDGKPEYPAWRVNPLSADSIATLTGEDCANTSPNGFLHGACGPELTKHLLNEDQSTVVDGEQFIQTFTIGFGLNDVNATNYLKALASVNDGSLAANDADSLKLAFENVIKRVQDETSPKLQLSGTPTFQSTGDGLQPALPAAPTLAELTDYEQQVMTSLFNPMSYMRTLAAGGFFEATDTATLLDAFNSIINKVTASASSFSSPSYQVDQGSLLSHSEFVYIPVFDRNVLPLWPGNLKKFKRDSAGKLIDKNGNDAVDAQGVFKDNAQDLWSATQDGKDVTKGGAANKLPLPDDRKLLTHTSDVKLNVPVLNLDKTNVTPVMLGLAASDNAMRDNLVDFARGKKADGTPRYHMGDMLNGKPQLITADDSKPYIIVGSNEGYLHAIDADTGVEKWAFMPKSLLKNVDTFYQNAQPKKHISGIDGALNVWRFQYDDDGDNVLDAADPYKTYVYFGLRQGGNEYYMLDISTIASPKIVWHITDQTSGFSELGQAWSKPAFAKMRLAKNSPENTTHDSELVDVLVFGGGYDPVKNTENTASVTRAADSKGRNVYIVRADNGELIWSLRDNVTGAAAKLTDSIPGDIRVMDMDRNGALDRLYFADTGGHVWRVDMDVDVGDLLPAGADTFYNYSKARLSEFANLGGSGVNKRMFFYEPDVALMQHRGKTILTLAIGSGYRTRPLSESDDRFYVFIDRKPFKAPSNTVFPILEDAKLVSLTNADGTDNTANIGVNKSLLTQTTLNGWYYDLPNTGEKVLAPAVTFLNKVVFTTFASAPAAEEGIDPCSAPPNSARAYVMDLFNGDAVVDLDRKDGDLERSVIAGINEILDAAQIVFSKPTAADGTACKVGDCGKQVAEVRVGKMNLPLIDNTNIPVGPSMGDILPRVFWRDELKGAE